MNSIAILVPTYNSVRTLQETLESVLAQDLSPVAGVYLADDASSDSTIELARKVWQSPTPLHVIAQPRNSGERHNVNTAMLQMPAHIEWVYILHSDDLAQPRWLSETLSQIRCAPATVASICSSWDNLEADGSVTPGENQPERSAVHIAGTPDSIRNTLMKGCWWHLSGCAIRASAFRDIGGFTEDMPQTGDWEWLLRCLRRGWGVRYIPQTLILYRQHNASVSSNSFRLHRDIKESLGIIKAHASYLTTWELCQLHALRAWALLMRFGRSLLRMQAERAARALYLLLVIPVSAATCLVSRVRHASE